MASLGKVLLVQAALFLAVLLSGMAFAAPVVSFNPNTTDLWLGEGLVIIANCSSIAGSTGATANLSYSGSDFPPINFSDSSGNYLAEVPSGYLSSTGEYGIKVNCTDNTGNVIGDGTEKNFNVSSKSSSLTTNSAIYSGSNITIYFVMKKNGHAINTYNELLEPVFHVLVDGSVKTPLDPFYSFLDSAWKFSIEQQNVGSHNLTVIANFNRTNFTNSSQISITYPVQISISPASLTINKGDVVTLTFNASNRGSAITGLSNSNVILDIDGIISFNLSGSSGSIYTARFAAPERSPKTYSLVLTLSDYNAAASIPVYYNFPVSGTIKDSSDKPVSATLTFTSSGGVSSSFSTSAGTYSGLLQPGIYDVSIKFPDSNVTFDSIYLNSFSDPVKYDHLAENSIAGLNSVAAFMFSFGDPLADHLDSATFEMSYNKNLVSDEDSLKVFSCDNWNYANLACNSYWNEMSAPEFTPNAFRHSMIVYSSDSTVFAIGTRQNLTLAANLEKEQYYFNDNAKLSGIVYGPGDSRISGAAVHASISGTTVKIDATSGESGEFIITFPIGIPDGNYTIVLTAEKSPFGKSSISKALGVAKKREVLINAPSSIRVARGNVLNQEIEIMNTGQVKLTDISLAISGIPAEWFAISQYSDSLDVNDKTKATVFFNIPESANDSTTSATITFSSAEMREEKKIGFTVMSNETKQVAETEQKAPSGSFLNFTLPKISYEYALAAAALAILAVIAVSFKPKGKGRDEIKSALSEVKSYLDIRMKKDNKYNFTAQKDYQEKHCQRADRGLVNG